AVVTAVRPGSVAEHAGLRAGHEIVAVAGVPTAQAIDARVGRSLRAPDAAARTYALLQLLAGRHDEPRRFTIASSTGSREIALDDASSHADARSAALVDARALDGGVGYIRLRNDLGNDDLVPAFDAALASLAASR